MKIGALHDQRKRGIMWYEDWATLHDRRHLPSKIMMRKKKKKIFFFINKLNYYFFFL